MKNLINLDATREFINENDIAIENKLQCLILEGSNIDALRVDNSISEDEEKSIRLLFKQIFIELFKHQDEWEEIKTNGGHFIKHPEGVDIYNLTDVFCNTLHGISLQTWLIVIGGKIFNVSPEIFDNQIDYHSVTSGTKKLSEFVNVYEQKLISQEITVDDVFCVEDIPDFEHKWKLDNSLITELDYFANRFEIELLINPLTVQRVQLNGDNDDAIDVLIFNQTYNVVEIYRKLRSLFSPEEAAEKCFDILHELLYNAVIKSYNNPLNELHRISLGI